MAVMGNQYAKGCTTSGRPSTYKPEYCQMMIDFFDVPKTKERLKAHITGKNEYVKEEYEEVANELPTFSKFERNNKLSFGIVTDWIKMFPEFRLIYNTCKELQKEFLMDNGLRGMYPPASYIFTAKNITDMRDEQAINLGGSLNFVQSKELDDLATKVEKANKSDYETKRISKELPDVKADTPLDKRFADTN